MRRNLRRWCAIFGASLAALAALTLGVSFAAAGVLVGTLQRAKSADERTRAIDEIVDSGPVALLRMFGIDVAVDPMIEILKNYPDERPQIANALGRIGNRRAVGPLIEALKDTGWKALSRGAVAGALEMIGDRSAVGPMTEALNEQWNDGVARALGRFGDPRATGPLVKALTYTTDTMGFAQKVGHMQEGSGGFPRRETAAMALSTILDSQGLEALPLEDRAHIWLGLEDVDIHDEINKHWQSIKETLLEDLKVPELQVPTLYVILRYRYYDDPDISKALEGILMKYGDKQMAEMFLSVAQVHRVKPLRVPGAGGPGLREAVDHWASAHGYRVVSQHFP